jgi:hypothetical protein
MKDRYYFKVATTDRRKEIEQELHVDMFSSLQAFWEALLDVRDPILLTREIYVYAYGDDIAKIEAAVKENPEWKICDYGEDEIYELSVYTPCSHKLKIHEKI